jgi:hypothetical protein
VPAARLVGARHLIRRLELGDCLLQLRMNLGGIINIGYPQVRPAGVDEQAVISAGEPGCDDLNVAAGVSLPAFAGLGVSDD